MAQYFEERTIVLVEDDAVDRARIHRMLHGQRRRYHIIDCASGGEALALMGVGDRRVDCVLLDQNLPDIDADELLRRLRAPSGDFRPR